MRIKVWVSSSKINNICITERNLVKNIPTIMSMQEGLTFTWKIFLKWKTIIREITHGKTSSSLALHVWIYNRIIISYSVLRKCRYFLVVGIKINNVYKTEGVHNTAHNSCWRFR